MGFENLTDSEGVGWPSSGWELTLDILRADGLCLQSWAQSASVSPLGPLGSLPSLCCVVAFLAMANRWQCCLGHETKLKDPKDPEAG